MLNLDKLNEEQKLAVLNTNGPLLVLAGAGTGKTTVITYKIAHLLSQGLCAPQEVLAVTFTNKAASQMQNRVERLCGQQLPNIGTFHSIALKILRKHAGALNLKSDLNVASYQDQIKIIKNIYLDYKIDDNRLDHKTAHQIITNWKDLSLTPEQVQTHEKLALDVYKHYQKHLVNSGLVDFSDILLYTNILWREHLDILEIYRQLFKYVLVDEYQDTNKAQHDWINFLAAKHQNICCVGDDDQSIYSWRGAQIANILNFQQQFPNANIITLSKNYRSTQDILDVAQSIISNNQNRYPKKLLSGSNMASFPVTLLSIENPEKEAEFIAQTSLKLAPEQTAAILVRTNFQTRVLEDVFTHLAVRYSIVGSLRFYDLKEIKDALAYIRTSINFHDDLAIERIINTPKRGIGLVALGTIRQRAIERQISIFDAVKSLLGEQKFGNKAAKELQMFLDNLQIWQVYFSSFQPAIATEKVLRESGYMAMLEQNQFETQKLDNIKELLVAISEHQNIKDFIDYIALNDSLNSKQTDELENHLKIMTVHAAKGLEFDVVFLPNWNEGVLPSSKALQSATSLEEERRIAYVAITRAKSLLYISHSAHAKAFGRDFYYTDQEPSRFIAEITPELLVKERYPKSRIIETRLNPGMVISHKIFGRGLIIKVINAETYQVGFKDAGIKTIHKDFLEIVS